MDVSCRTRPCSDNIDPGLLHCPAGKRVTRQVDELFLGLGDPVSVGLRINAANSVLQQQPGYY